MKKTIAVILALCCQLYGVEAKVRHCAQLYYTSSDVYSHKCDSSLLNVKVRYLTKEKNVVAKYADGSKRFVPCDSIWGFRNRQNVRMRVVGGIVYKVDFDAPIYVYETGGKIKRYFFSMGPDSRVIAFNRKNLLENLDRGSYEMVMSDKKMRRRL